VPTDDSFLSEAMMLGLTTKMRPISTREIALPVAIILISASAAGLLSSVTPASSAAVWNVAVLATSFDPDTLSVSVGDTVVWNVREGTHTVISYSGQAESWNSGVLQVGDSYNYTFSQSGNFTYYCAQHVASGMTGVIMVASPVPEFPGFMLILALCAAVAAGLCLERRWNPHRPSASALTQ
jgi:plastocyanin